MGKIHGRCAGVLCAVALAAVLCAMAASAPVWAEERNVRADFCEAQMEGAAPVLPDKTARAAAQDGDTAAADETPPRTDVRGVVIAAAVVVMVITCGFAAYVRISRQYQRSLLQATAAAESARDQLLVQMKLTEEYHRISETDALTGLYNRCAGQERIDWLARHGRPGMFCLLDVDQFKQVNDTFGHGVGDEALKSVSDCLRASFRDGDVILRLGGDEFGVFAPGVDTEGKGKEILCRFYERMGDAGVPGMGRGELSVSTGAAINCGGCTSFMALYETADDAMYRCKGETERFCIKTVSCCKIPQ